MRLVILSFVLVACSSAATPAPTGAACPDPDPGTLTWDSFGQTFMASYCLDCHLSTLTHSARNGAPLYHDYDTLTGVLETAEHIDQDSGSGPDASNSRMPPSQCPSVAGGPLNRSCPQPTEAERANLSVWLACESLRPH
jgi:hypothetical protein